NRIIFRESNNGQPTDGPGGQNQGFYFDNLTSSVYNDHTNGTGNDEANVITGNGGDNILKGLGGNDTLIGGGGLDTAAYQQAITPSTIAPNNQGGWTVTTGGPEGTDTLSQISEVTGSDPDPILLVGNGGFATIQDAVNAAHNGDTILVAPGTYSEQVLINGKTLTLQAEDGVTLKAPPTLSTSFTLPAGSTATPNKFALIGVENGGDGTIANFHIDGLGQGDQANGGDYAGVYFWNSDGKVLDSTITGIRNGGPSGTLDGIQHGNGIVGFVTDGSSHTVEVGNTDVSDFQKTGMVFNGDGLTANAHDNTVTGAGDTTVIGQNGIQIGFGATGTVTNNTISGVGYGNPSVDVAAGVLVFQAGSGVTVDNNHITGDTGDGDAGVYFVDSDAAVAHGNTLTDLGFGVVDQGTFTTPIDHGGN